MRRNSELLRLGFALVTCAAFAVACGGSGTSQRPEVVPGPAIPGLNLTGAWYSQDFGDMELVQSGDRLTGKYQHPRGPEHDGTLRGEITGDVLRIEWIQPGDTTSGVFPIRGRAWFRIGAGGRLLDGRWGYDADDGEGGPWRAEKSQFQ